MHTQINDDPNISPEQARINSIQNAFRHLPAAELQRFDVNIDDYVPENSPDAEKLIHAWSERQIELVNLMQSIVKPAELMANYSQQLNSLDIFALDEKLVILEELDSLLTDIDNARDFHTIGAWPILVRQLHSSNPAKIRAKAAIAVGTAVKNSYDYQLWLLEEVEESDTLNVGSKSGIELLLDMLQESISSSSQLSSTDRIDFQRRALYALSSGLRGNMDVQDRVLALGKSDKRFDIFVTLATIAMNNSTTAEVMRKIWSLAADMIEERDYIRNELVQELKIMGVDIDDIGDESLSKLSSNITEVVRNAITSLNTNPLFGDYFMSHEWIVLAVRILNYYLMDISQVTTAIATDTEGNGILAPNVELSGKTAVVRNILTTLYSILKGNSSLFQQDASRDWQLELQALWPRLLHIDLGLEPNEVSTIAEVLQVQ